MSEELSYYEMSRKRDIDEARLKIPVQLSKDLNLLSSCRCSSCTMNIDLGYTNLLDLNLSSLNILSVERVVLDGLEVADPENFRHFSWKSGYVEFTHLTQGNSVEITLRWDDFGSEVQVSNADGLL